MKNRNNYDDLFKEIGLRIAKQIEAHGETQAVLAKALGYDDHQTVTYWVNGKRKPNLGQLLAIAQRYNVSMDYLTTFSDAETDATPEGKELQFVCEYTGLSSQSVQVLQYLKKDMQPGGDPDHNRLITRFINRILEMLYPYLETDDTGRAAGVTNLFTLCEQYLTPARETKIVHSSNGITGAGPEVIFTDYEILLLRIQRELTRLHDEVGKTLLQAATSKKPMKFETGEEFDAHWNRITRGGKK